LARVENVQWQSAAYISEFRSKAFLIMGFSNHGFGFLYLPSAIPAKVRSWKFDPFVGRVGYQRPYLGFVICKVFIDLGLEYSLTCNLFI